MATKNRPKIQYNYYVHPISKDDETAYKAVIPAFNNAIVYGDSLDELEEGVAFAIENEIKDCKKNGKPIPEPSADKKYNGKILLRVEPVLHERLMEEAQANGKSLNAYITEHYLN